MDSTEAFAYIGRDAAGCIRAVIAESAGQRRVARQVGDMIRDGLTVERVTCEYVRQTDWIAADCPDHQPKPAKPPVQAALI